MADNAQAEALAAEVLASPKYRAICPALVRELAARELAAHRSRKEALKAVKNKLHQIAGAYFDSRPDYQGWLNELQIADCRLQIGADQPATANLRSSTFQAACRRVMARHASTRERLPILERFYAEALAGIPPPRAVLDVACGLGPLALPWMPLAPGAAYYACDIYADLADFLNGFFALVGVPGRAEVCDLLKGPPAQRVDLALALKLLPVLEQLDRAAPLRLLRALNAPHILVSFPAHSLGGRGKGMVEHYERRFHELIGGEGWRVETFYFPTELAFLVIKPR